MPKNLDMCGNCVRRSDFSQSVPCCWCTRNLSIGANGIRKDNYEEPEADNAPEVHIWLTAQYPDYCLCSYEAALYAFEHKQKHIDTTQTHFCSTRVLDAGYRLFVHFPSGEVQEVVYGSKNAGTSRYIRPGHNLEKLLLSEEFGSLKIV